MERNWDKELAKIDKQMGALSDDDLARRPVAASSGGRSASPAMPAGTSDRRTLWGVAFRVGLAVALGIAVPFWPYAFRCGLSLAGYLGAVTVLTAAGVWASISTWRARMARTHVAALLVIVWGASLAAAEVLPRIGYANDDARGAWICH